MQHTLIATKRIRGGSPIKGLRGTSGTNVKCSCGGWTSYSNEAPPSKTQAWQKRVFTAHVESTSLESDIARGREQLAKATDRLVAMLAEGEELPSYVEATTRRIAELGKSLAADLTEARYGHRPKNEQD